MIKYSILTLSTLILFSGNSIAGLKIYYMRHAEGGHNVKKEWEKKGVPKAEWPIYVGNPNMFTPKGKNEVIAATEKLSKYKFDFVASSPMWRARNTILPYLKLTGLKAEVWPELREGPGMKMILSKDVLPITEVILNKGDEIEIPTAETAFFSTRLEATRNYLKYPKGSIEEEKTAYMKHVSLHAIKVIEKRFGGSDKSILLAGHNSAGVSLLKLLLGKEPGGKANRGLVNASLWMVEQQPDGSYILKVYNDEPYI